MAAIERVFERSDVTPVGRGQPADAQVSATLCLAIGAPSLQAVLQLGNRHPLAIQIGLQHLQAAFHGVAMGVDKPGHQHFAVQVQHAGMGRFQAQHLVIAAHRYHLAVFDGNRLLQRLSWLCRVYPAAVQNQIRRRYTFP